MSRASRTSRRLPRLRLVRFVLGLPSRLARGFWHLRKQLDQRVFHWLDRRLRQEEDWVDSSQLRKRRLAWAIVAFGAVFTMIAAVLIADAPRRVAASYRRAADEAIARRDWSAASLACRRLTALEPERPEHRFKGALIDAERQGPQAAVQAMRRLAPDETIGYRPAHRWFALNLAVDPSLWQHLPCPAQRRTQVWRHHVDAARDGTPNDRQLESLAIALAAHDDPHAAQQLLNSSEPKGSSREVDRAERARQESHRLLRLAVLQQLSGEREAAMATASAAIERNAAASTETLSLDEFASGIAQRILAEEYSDAAAFIDRHAASFPAPVRASAIALVNERTAAAHLDGRLRERDDELWSALARACDARADRVATFELLQRALTESSATEQTRNDDRTVAIDSPGASLIAGYRSWHQGDVEGARNAWQRCARFGAYGVALLNNHAFWSNAHASIDKRLAVELLDAAERERHDSALDPRIAEALSETRARVGGRESRE